MAAQKGKDFLLQVSDDGTSGGTLNDLGGVQTTRFSINNADADITSADDAGRWRQMLAGAGVRSVDWSGDLVFVDDAGIEDLRAHAVDGANGSTQAYLAAVIPDFGTFAGMFTITQLEFSGQHDAEVRVAITAASAGNITFTAAV